MSDVITVKKVDCTGNEEHVVAYTNMPNARARLALDLVSRWGLVAASPDDRCDEAGRQKGFLQTPEDVVARAIDIADRTYTALEFLGWLVEVPPPMYVDLSRSK